LNNSRTIRFADEMYGDAGALRRAFSDPPQVLAPFLYLPVVNEGDDASPSRIDRMILSYKKDGYAGVIPYYPSEARSRPFEEGYVEAMHAVYEACAAYGLKSGYFDDPTVMASWLEKNPDEADA